MNKLDRIIDIALQIIRLQSKAAARQAERAAMRVTRHVILCIIATGCAIGGLSVLLVAMYQALALVMPAPGALALVGLLLMIMALITYLMAGSNQNDVM